MTYDDFLTYAENKGISVDTLSGISNRALAVNISGVKGICLNADIETEAERKACLAHEIGHCVTDSFYSVKTPLVTRGKLEHIADKWAIPRLVPLRKLRYAVRKLRLHNAYELAEYFAVPEDVINRAYNFYSVKGVKI